MHIMITMSVSGSCKLVWIISPGIYELSAWQTVDSVEKVRYELSHLDLHYLCGYPYQSTGSEGLTLVPTFDLSIWGHAQQNLLEDLWLSKTWISLHAHNYSIVRMSLIWAYQRALPEQRVTSQDSDLASLIITGWSVRACCRQTFFVDSIPFRGTVLNTDQYIQTIYYRNLVD